MGSQRKKFGAGWTYCILERIGLRDQRKISFHVQAPKPPSPGWKFDDCPRNVVLASLADSAKWSWSEQKGPNLQTDRKTAELWFPVFPSHDIGCEGYAGHLANDGCVVY